MIDMYTRISEIFGMSYLSYRLQSGIFRKRTVFNRSMNSLEPMELVIFISYYRGTSSTSRVYPLIDVLYRFLYRVVLFQLWEVAT